MDYDFQNSDDLPDDLKQRRVAAQSTLDAIERETAAYRLSQLTKMPTCPVCGTFVRNQKCPCPCSEITAAYGGLDAIQKHLKVGRYSPEIG
jgi:hypothetical protein